MNGNIFRLITYKVTMMIKCKELFGFSEEAMKGEEK